MQLFLNINNSSEFGAIQNPCVALEQIQVYAEGIASGVAKTHYDAMPARIPFCRWDSKWDMFFLSIFHESDHALLWRIQNCLIFTQLRVTFSCKRDHKHMYHFEYASNSSTNRTDAIFSKYANNFFFEKS